MILLLNKNTFLLLVFYPSRKSGYVDSYQTLCYNSVASNSSERTDTRSFTTKQRQVESVYTSTLAGAKIKQSCLSTVLRTWRSSNCLVSSCHTATCAGLVSVPSLWKKTPVQESRSISTRTSLHQNSFFPSAVSVMKIVFRIKKT